MPRATQAVVVQPLTEIAPARPAPLRLWDETYKVCGKELCLSTQDAQRMLKNRIATWRWIKQANAVMDYYDKRQPAAAPNQSAH